MLKDVVAALCTGTGRMKPVLTTVGATVHRMRSSRFTGRATWWSTSRCAWSGSASSCWCDEGRAAFDRWNRLTHAWLCEQVRKYGGLQPTNVMSELAACGFAGLAAAGE